MTATSTPRRALLSVYDKAGLIDFARGLRELGFELVSSGGTASNTVVESGGEDAPRAEAPLAEEVADASAPEAPEAPADAPAEES